MANKAKISCLPVSLFPQIADGSITFKELAAKCKGFGLDAIDVSTAHFKNHTPSYIRELKAGLSETGMPIHMAMTYPDFTNPDAVQRMRELDYLRGDIALCSALDIPTIRVLAGQNHKGITREEGIRWAVDNLTEAAKTAKAYGITLLFEDHAKPSIWDCFDFSFDPEIFIAIAKRLHDNESGVKINFDTGNIAAFGDDPLRVLKEVIDDVMTIHVFDMAEKGKMSPCLTGTGVVDFAGIFAYLKQAGWDGWLCIEEFSRTGWDGIEKSARYVREVWERQ